MIFVIQCASSKDDAAPGFRSRDGRKVAFVAHPDVAGPKDGVVWAHPDAPSETPGFTWRQLLVQNNASRNPLGLRCAWELYRPREYRMLVERFGVDRVLILSAGWGLVQAAYPLPAYDISLSGSAEPHKRRRKADHFADFVQVDDSVDGPLVFLGGRDYLPLFEQLTHTMSADKIAPFRCAPGEPAAPQRRGELSRVPFPSTRRTNWHYACVAHLCRDPSWIDQR